MENRVVPWVQHDDDGNPKCRLDHELGRTFVKPELSAMRHDREYAGDNYHAALDMMALAAEMMSQASLRANAVLHTKKIATPAQRKKMERVNSLYQKVYEEASKIIRGE